MSLPIFNLSLTPSPLLLEGDSVSETGHSPLILQLLNRVCAHKSLYANGGGEYAQRRIEGVGWSTKIGSYCVLAKHLLAHYPLVLTADQMNRGL